mmetsp:Transcript_20011/g.14723  ORF Transcript_20011/g.14723 Transcript_20011/m.14723 type:complete len:85 (+) Transcript_20011:2975-3229(+)
MLKVTARRRETKGKSSKFFQEEELKYNFEAPTEQESNIVRESSIKKVKRESGKKSKRKQDVQLKNRSGGDFIDRSLSKIVKSFD